MFRTVPLSIIRSFFTVHTAMVCHTGVLTACGQDQDGTQFHPDPTRKLSANLYDIHHCCVYSEETPDDGQRKCPKYVEFYSRNKFQKLVHLVGFNIQIYYDARSYECQKKNGVFVLAG